jgi:hypothetical protein
VLPAVAPWCALLAFAAMQRPRWMAAGIVAGGAVCLAVTLALAWHSPHTSKFAAAELAAHWKPGDRVVFVGEMFYDVPFYAGLNEPPIIVSTWSDPEIPKRDNWRKELYDAAQFDPARAHQLLWPLARIGELTCHAQAVWFVASPRGLPSLAPLQGLQTLYTDPDVVLLRAAGRPC